eukprot:1139900-Pelagomonas_calceolata.AAC.4
MPCIQQLYFARCKCKGGCPASTSASSSSALPGANAKQGVLRLRVWFIPGTRAGEVKTSVNHACQESFCQRLLLATIFICYHLASLISRCRTAQPLLASSG